MKRRNIMLVGALVTGVLIGLSGPALLSPKPAAACSCKGEELCGAASAKPQLLLAAAARCKRCGTSCKCGAICRCPK